MNSIQIFTTLDQSLRKGRITPLNMHFKQAKWLVIFCFFSLLTACGGGSSSDGVGEGRDNDVDLLPPIITLNGESRVSIIQGREYVDAGASANDDVDGLVLVSISGHVDTETLGTYSLSYSATDAAGNESTIIRTVIVRESLPFITTWKTDNPGGSEDNQITITTTTDDQNYTIDWGDGTQNRGVTGGITHTYSSAGIYTVSISEGFKNIRFNQNHSFNLGDNNKLLAVEQWGEVQWSTMEKAFYDCENLVLNATDAPDLSGVSSMSLMFFRATAFNQDIGHWDVSAVTDMSGLFTFARTFNQDIGQWDVSAVTDMSGLFTFARTFNQDIGQWDVSAVTDMSSMFEVATTFNQNIGQWDVSAVQDMNWMFAEAYDFNQDISQWDVSRVTDMGYMFLFTDAFNQDIGQWDVSAVKDMRGMFGSAQVFDQDIGLWDVSSVADMTYMFGSAQAFDQDISQWDVSSVTGMSEMFKYASAFNQDIGQWDVSAVNLMDGMFEGAAVFNQDIGQWDVSAVDFMVSMFEGATAFNQDIGQWDVSSVTNMRSMFKDITLATLNYDALLQGWGNQTLQADVDFDGGNSRYSSASEPARNVLMNTFNWSIADGGLAAPIL